MTRSQHLIGYLVGEKSQWAKEVQVAFGGFGSMFIIFKI